ncbi:hypothetical protein EWM62_01715 [Mucilaginibacter terrigena]|uniref:Cupin n=1 Tax=Mucilaginibacter terrigena TaxID=2492395 RepID=A0A4Q5LRU5_9SPHI|nr:hypothetical protein [Mucilaginibacter terrigena]RYU92177.1 hypothetical protein EWM62_01715 [Mucilaginibacter terrigena]
MIIKDILDQLTLSDRPVARVIRSSPQFKTLIIALKAGMVWPNHKATLPTILIVTEGSVVYKKGDRQVQLNKHDDYQIPVDIIHSLKAEEDSICILIQG